MLSCLLGAACAEAPAVRSRWNIQPRSNVVQSAVETDHGTGGRSVDAPLTPATLEHEVDKQRRESTATRPENRFERLRVY